MSVNLSPLAGAGWQFFDNDGVILAGGLIYTYAAGSSTPLATYTTSAGNIANANPIQLDSSGRTPSEVWLTAGSTYKFEIKTATGTLIRSWDNISGINDTSTLADLANSSDPAKGDALVGFRQSNSSGNLPNTIGRTVHQKFQPYIDAHDFGALGLNADYTTQLQNAINATPLNGALYLPNGIYQISSQLVINQAITIFSDNAHNTGTIICLGCSAFKINKVANVEIKSMTIAQAVRYTTTPNSYYGIEVPGDTVNRPYNLLFRDLYIDGFQTAIDTQWMWSSVLDNVESDFGKYGLIANNLSANNVVTNCSFNGDGTGNAITLDGSVDPSEGWMINNTLTFNNYYGVYGKNIAHIYISNCIFDFNYQAGILLTNDSPHWSANWGIVNNYIALNGSTAQVGIWSTNSVNAALNIGNMISGNTILAYPGATALYGIYMEGAQSNNNVISGNTLKNFTNNDIRTNGVKNIIIGNNCQSAISFNIDCAAGIVQGNVGTYVQNSLVLWSGGQRKITYATVKPASGTWDEGDICLNLQPGYGEPTGWTCTTAGTPGTWYPFAQVGATASVGSAPSFVGEIAVVGSTAYIAVATSASGDWKQIT
jgi:hypothetical protein